MRRAACLIVTALLAGCQSAPRGYQPPKTVRYERASAAVPPYAELAVKYNSRVLPLDHLRAAVTLTIDSPDEGGGRRNDQVEGNLQFSRDRRVALRLDKVGETLAYLGSNDEKYWWLELRGEKQGLVGSHAKATPRSAARFGIPVHPLDLIDLLAVLPLPASGEVRASEDGRLIVRLPSRGPGWGERRLILDAEMLWPVRVEVRDPRGALVAAADLTRYVQVQVRGDPNSPAMLASRYDVAIPGEDTTVTVSVHDPENPRERMRTAPFDLPLLLSSYGVERVLDVDAGDVKREPAR